MSAITGQRPSGRGQDGMIRAYVGSGECANFQSKPTGYSLTGGREPDLALAISRRIIEMHGERIWVESNPGHGSIFAFALPATVEVQARPA